jgi:hypothetical protein
LFNSALAALITAALSLQFCLAFTARYEESDFGDQIVEVSIEENGATITGFPVLGFPA